MEKPLYFISDLDGTLLHKSKSFLHPSNKQEQAIKELLAEGHQFVIATGRGYKDCVRVCENLNIPIPYAIVQNGAIIYKNGEQIVAKILENELIQEIRDFIRRQKLPVHYFSITDMDWKMHINVLTLKGYGLRKLYQKRDPQKFLRLKKRTLLKLAEQSSEYCKILLFVDPHKIAQVESALTQEFGQRIAIFASSRYNIEICAHGVSKANAIKQLAEMEAIEESKIGFVGDSGNDVSAFEAFNHTYVMNHAPDKYKISGTQKVTAVCDAIEHFRAIHKK
ncbi:MAG: Cof-type HAD-IIB family hydrolase [Culicoidibacterales bacterium]